MEMQPKDINFTKLTDAFKPAVVEDLSSRYPKAFVSLLRRDPAEIDQVLALQSKAEGVILSIANSNIGNSKDRSVTNLISELQDRTLGDTKKEIDSQPGARAFISFTGQGGAGKDTVMTNFLDKMEAEGLSAVKVVCSTTREPRPGEKDGEAYHFINDDKIFSLLSNVNITSELVSQLTTLGINFKGDKFTKELLDEIKEKTASKGATLFFDNTAEQASAPIYLTYNPGRGWYTIVNSAVTAANEKSPLSLVIEDPMIVTRVIESSKAKNPDLIGKIICVLPPHPMILHMALRAITRDEVLAEKTEPLSAESLFSTIGERQLDILRDFSRIPKDMLIILVNDKFENGVTLASTQLFDAFKGLVSAS